MPWNLPEPPSGITGPVRDYLQSLRKAVNSMPVFSYGSYATPESTFTGQTLEFFINTGSASTFTRLFMNIGASTSSVSWVAVQVLG